MYIAILGRQPELGLAELTAQHQDTQLFSDQAALIESEHVEIDRLGGTLKLGLVKQNLKAKNLEQTASEISAIYKNQWRERDGKLTLGVSVYGFNATKKQVQALGLKLKSAAASKKGSVRLIPSQDTALSTATSHHNKLGRSDNKVELLIVRGSNGEIILAESVGSQNISAYAARDQKRPKRDAFVGMLPPKLAQIMINLAAGQLKEADSRPTILDSFCGTGVVLQEAALMGYQTYGTDLSEKMIDYSKANLEWLAKKHRHITQPRLEPGDAMTHQWHPPIDAVVCETYLGQPFSAPPSPAKLREVRSLCSRITSEFLENLHTQIKPGTPLCLAVPAWRGTDGKFTHVSVASQEIPGYTRIAQSASLLYHRPDQVVARQLIVLRKT